MCSAIMIVRREADHSGSVGRSARNVAEREQIVLFEAADDGGPVLGAPGAGRRRARRVAGQAIIQALETAPEAWRPRLRCCALLRWLRPWYWDSSAGRQQRFHRASRPGRERRAACGSLRSTRRESWPVG